MIQGVSHPSDPRIDQALCELEELIQSRFPDATFAISWGEDPEGFYLDAIVDLDDPDVVMDIVIERLLEFQVGDGLPIQVVPLRTQAREVQLLADQHSSALLLG